MRLRQVKSVDQGGTSVRFRTKTPFSDCHLVFFPLHRDEMWCLTCCFPPENFLKLLWIVSHNGLSKSCVLLVSLLWCCSPNNSGIHPLLRDWSQNSSSVPYPQDLFSPNPILGDLTSMGIFKNWYKVYNLRKWISSSFLLKDIFKHGENKWCITTLLGRYYYYSCFTDEETGA